MEINLAQSTVRYSNFPTNSNESLEEALDSSRELVNFLDESLFKLKDLLGHEDEGVILLGHKCENDLFFNSLDRVEIKNHHTTDQFNEYWIELLPKKFRNRETNEVYWDMTEKFENFDSNDTNREIIRFLFFIKLLESIKNVKIVLTINIQAYDTKSGSHFLANLSCFFDKIISFKKNAILLFAATSNETTKSGQIKSDIALFLSDPINLINLDETKKSNLEYIGGEEFVYNILTLNNLDVILVDSENKQIENKFSELIETLSFVSSDKFDMNNSIPFVLLDSVYKIKNKSADATIKSICYLIQNVIHKFSEDLGTSIDIYLKKSFIDSLRNIQVTIHDFTKNGFHSGREYDFFSILNEKIIFLCKDNDNFYSIKNELDKYSFYYYFFLRVRTESAVGYYVKVKEWLEHFENIRFGLEKLISKEDRLFREKFQISVENTKELMKKIQFFYSNEILAKYGKVNPGFFMQQFFTFQKKYVGILQNIEHEINKESWFKLVENLSDNIFKCFNIEFKIEEVKLAFELKLLLNEPSTFEIDLIKELRQLEAKILDDYPKYLSKCILDLKQIVNDKVDEYTNKFEIFCKKEKNYKNILSVKCYLELVFLKKDNFKDFIENLKQLLPQIQEQSLLDITTILNLLYGNEVFCYACDKDMFQKEFTEASARIGKIITTQCDFLLGELVVDTKSQLEENFKEIKESLKKICTIDSNKTIRIYQKLNTFFIEQNTLPDESITNIVKTLRKMLIEDETSLDDKIILSQSIDKLKISEYLNENSDIKFTFLNGILVLKQFVELIYEKFLRDKLNFIWHSLAKSVESLNNSLEKRYAYEAKDAIDLLKEFALILTNKNSSLTIVQIKEKLLTFDECFSKNFSFLTHFFDFASLNNYLIELLKNYNAEEIKIEFYSSKDDSNQLKFLIEKLKSSLTNWIDVVQFLAKNSISCLKNDLEKKIQKEEMAENFSQVKEYSTKLLGSLEEIKAMTKDVATFASLILDRIGFTLSEETKKHLELIKKDFNDSRFILKELDKIVILYLNEKINHSIKSIKIKEESIKAEKIKNCFCVLKNDIEECLKMFNDDQKCLSFLLSLLNVLREIRDGKLTNKIQWICLKLDEFWKSQKEKEPLKSTFSSLEQHKSQEFLEDMRKEHNINSPIPEDSYSEIKSVYEVFKARRKDYEDSIKHNEELFSNSLLKAVEIFEKEIDEYINTSQDKSLSKSAKIVEIIRDSLKSNKISEISALLIFDFESPLVQNESSRLFEDLKAKEISIVNQTQVKKSIKKILTDTVDNLNKMIKELEVKTYKDTADSIAANLVYLIDELIKIEIEKSTGFNVFLSFLEKVKKFFEKIDFDKLNKFSQTLSNFSVEFNAKIDNLEVIKDRDLPLYPQTRNCLYNLKESVKFRLNWYKLVKIMFEKINEGRLFDGGSLSISGFQTGLEDTEYLRKLLRRLNINFEKGLFNWSQSLSYNDFELIKNSELTVSQKYELQLLSKQVVENFESIYDPEKKRLVINGNFIVMSNVINEVQKNDIILVIIKSNNVVYFDKNIVANGISFFIISPYWHVENSIIVNLSGINAKQHVQKKAQDGSDSQSNGENGLDGVSGQDAGHFYGICGNQTMYDSIKNLNFLVEGGNGADGQQGGDGKNGEPGKNALPIHIFIDNFNETEQNDIKVSVKTTGFLIKKNIKVFSRNGGEGQTGGNSGNGGNGGQGGNGGNVRILLDKKFLNCNGQTGIFGKIGKHGMIGKGGKHGNGYESHWDMKEKKWIEENKVIVKKFASDGCFGVDGKVSRTSNTSSLKLNSEEIKLIIREFLDRKIFSEKNDIFLKLQYEHLNKFHDELQVYVRKPEYFINGQSF